MQTPSKDYMEALESTDVLLWTKEDMEQIILHTMQKKRFNESQIVAAIKKQEAGISVKEICRELTFSEAIFYNTFSLANLQWSVFLSDELSLSGYDAGIAV